MAKLAKHLARKQLARKLAANKTAEDRYVRALRGLMRGIAKGYMRALAPELKSLNLVKDSVSDSVSDARDPVRPPAHVIARIRVKIDTLKAAIQPQIKRAVEKAFAPMAKGVTAKVDQGIADVTGQRIQAIKLRDLEHHEEITAARNANIQLVEKAHRTYAEDVRAIFDNPDNFSVTVNVLKAMLFERADVSESRAELIARDQTLKLNGDINRIWQTDAGVSDYVWSTSRDERVRETHQELDGETFSWSDPPSVGHPGEDYQCRCVAVPVIDFG